MSNEDDRDEKHCLTIKELRDLLLQMPAEYDNAVVLARVTDSEDETHIGDLRSGQIEYGCCSWPALILAATRLCLMNSQRRGIAGQRSELPGKPVLRDIVPACVGSLSSLFRFCLAWGCV